MDSIRSSLAEAVRTMLSVEEARYFHWLVASTVILLVGAVLEEAERWFPNRARVDPNLGIVIPLRGRIRMYHAVTTVGLVMVIVGIAGEGLFEVLGSGVSDDLREFNEFVSNGLQSDLAETSASANSAVTANKILASKLEQERQKTARENTALVDKSKALADELGEQKRAAASAASQLEGEKKKRLELAVSLLPREFGDQSGAVQKLKAFHGVKAIFEWISDKEALRTAEQINFALSFSGWARSWRTSKMPEYARDGVMITAGRMFPDSVLFVEPHMTRLRGWGDLMKVTSDAAAALRDELNRSGIVATVGIEESDKLPPDTILISVGPKPNTVLEQSLKELALPGPSRMKEPADDGHGSLLGGPARGNSLGFANHGTTTASSTTR